MNPFNGGLAILPGVRFWAGVFTLVFGFQATACSHPTALHSRETTRGTIQYTLHSPDTPARRHVIFAHGFLRSPQTMHHLAEAWSKQGFETASIKLRHSKPWNANHTENANDIIALRESLGWRSAVYVGFSAGALSSSIAAAADESCQALLLLDPVDHGALGMKAARKIHVPTLAILGKPGPGNAHGNAAPMLDAIPNVRIIQIPEASHCDFEARHSPLCGFFTGSPSEPSRTAAVHKSLLRETSYFLESISTNPIIP